MRWTILVMVLLCTDLGYPSSSLSMPDFFRNYTSWPFWRMTRPPRRRQQFTGTGVSEELPKLDPAVVQESARFGQNVIERMERLEKTLTRADVRVYAGTPAHGQYIAGKPAGVAMDGHKQAQIAIRASQYIADTHCRRLGLKEKRCSEFVNSLSLKGTPLNDHCEESKLPNCDPKFPYRSVDGTCNNLKSPNWGQSFTAYGRILQAHYADGLSQLRKSVQNKTASLPGPREVSIALIADEESSEKEATLAVMQWAQFVGQDLSHTPSARMMYTSSSITCCKPDGGSLSPRFVHPFCASISVPTNDPVFNRRKCLDYIRSVVAPRPDCNFGPAEQMNQATHWMDLSMIYGTTDEASSLLRTHENGQLLTSSGPASSSLLPLSKQPTEDCQLLTKPVGPCFKSGDNRVNEQPMLTALHTIWVREHNRLAEELNDLNPTWDDERLFQEARKIAIAEFQHITYNEWLPVLLGDQYVQKTGLQKSFYSNKVNPAVKNSFATAALQFVYSMMPGDIHLFNSSRQLNSTLKMREHYNKPGVLHEDGRLDQLLRTMATQNAQKADLVHTDEVTSGLFAGDAPLGFDALSLVIQRGRDHGLPGYNDFRAACGLSKISSIDEFADRLPKTVVSRLKSLYASVNDVDLYVGAMAESAAEGSLVGPTFRCLLGRQFKDTRTSDRFFYDLQDQAGAFTPDQLSAIKQTSLARVLCENGDDIKLMQPNVFLSPDSKGSGGGVGPADTSVTQCSNLPVLDLSPWKE